MEASLNPAKKSLTEDIAEPVGTKAWGVIVVVRWLASQPFTNLLLIFFLGALTYSMRWAVIEGVPSHLRQIQEGYNSVIESNNNAAKDRRDTFAQQLQMIAEKFDRDQERDFKTNQTLYEERKREWERRKAELDALQKAIDKKGG